MTRRIAPYVAALVLVGALSWQVGLASAAFPGRNGQLGWSFSHGETCGASGCRGTVEIKGLDTGSGQRRVLACDALGPHFSPSGRQLAFSRPAPGIFTKAVDAPSRARLVPGSAQSYAATWAPDGRRLAFHTFVSQRSINADIHTSRIDGSHRRRVTFGGHSYQPVWGPDGRIAFAWLGRRRGVFVVNPDGTGRRRVTLTPNTGDEDSAVTTEAPESWSPDGRRIAFVRHRRDFRSRVYVVNADGSGLHRVATGAAFAAWAPNGKRIAIAGGKHTRRIDTVRPDGTDRRPLTSEPQQGSARCHNDQGTNLPGEIGFSGLDWQPLPPAR